MPRQLHPSSVKLREPDLGNRFPGLTFCLAVLTASAMAADALPVENAGPTGGAAPVGELFLVTDDFVAGQLVDSEEPHILRWQAAAFTRPFEFDVPAIRSVRFAAPGQQVARRPTGDYCFELTSGDFLYGALVDVTEQEVVIDVQGQGRLHVRRANLRRIIRWKEGNALVYDGPHGLDEWAVQPDGAWTDEVGVLASTEASGSLYRDFEMPSQVRMEIRLAWKASPDFALALGVSSDEKARRHAFRLEVWRDELVLVRERQQDADVVLIQKVGPIQGHAHLHVYLDQGQGHMLVYSPEGDLLGELDFQEQDSPHHGGIQFSNSGGEVRLERLRITHWNGQPPRQDLVNLERIQLADGSTLQGTLRGYSAQQQRFSVFADGREASIPNDRLESVTFTQDKPTDKDEIDLPPPRILVVRRDGIRLSGELLKVRDGQLWLSIPGIREPWKTPFDQLLMLIVQRHDVPSTPVGGRIGRLEIPGARLQGQLADGSADGDASGLVWHPRGSHTASPVRSDVAGRIVYHEPRRENPARPSSGPGQVPGQAPRQAIAPAPRVGIVGGFFRALSGEQTATSPRTAMTRALRLRTGDVIPGEVKRIDELGVTFRTSITEATFVPHDKIKSLDLDNAFGSPKADPVKRERLLTLPRMQRGNPPTHLIISRNGDFLRARLLDMDEQRIRVELRLETRMIPRDRVAQIIWLHDDELDPSDPRSPKDPAGASDSLPGGMRVQALRQDGIRLTFHADEVSDETVIGSSDVLGPCRVAVNEVDQLLLGAMIERAAARLASHQWRLQHAPDPKYLAEDAGSSGERLPGTESSLVGEMAPGISLPLLQGDRFNLADYRGRVVVLDFWASWCGPCLQVMPQIERVVHAYDEEQVVLIAVNLQETPDTIRSTLERWRLAPTVALDRDGVAAQRYQVTAIPQTVIIDAEGRIARLFIGGGTDFGDRLEQALADVVGGP